MPFSPAIVSNPASHDLVQPSPKGTLPGLVIESASDTTKIEIKRRAGGATQEMTVEPGAQLTRLYAGDYDITIHEGSDQVSIEPKQVQLRRGETVIARIVRSQKQESGSTQSGTMGGAGAAVPEASQRYSFAGVSLPASVETILFKGKTLSEWLLVLERERDPVAWLEAFEALHKADPQLVNSLSHAIREIGLQHHFFSPVSNGWFLPVFSHEELDRLVLESIQGESLQACLEILSAVAKMPKLKLCNGDVYQASRLSQSWAFVEEKLSTSAPSSELLNAILISKLFHSIAKIKDTDFLKTHPWIAFLTHRIQIDTQKDKDFTSTIATLLSDPKLDLDRFLLLAAYTPFSGSADDDLDACREQVRERLANELHRWAGSGKVLGGLGMGRRWSQRISMESALDAAIPPKASVVAWEVVAWEVAGGVRTGAWIRACGTNSDCKCLPCARRSLAN